MKRPIKIIDLFAGPGGLGEGFSAYENTDREHPFKIRLSVEKEASAHRTLQLRAFYRQFPDGEAPPEYYDFLSGALGRNPESLYTNPRFRREALSGAEEARQYTLGEDNRAINSAIENALGQRPGPWVLIGGPPCQAYSVVGRARNRGVKGYSAETDHRNFLYKEYLKVIARFAPAVFVVENVKGMLSANVGGVSIFDQIRKDLECPARALNSNEARREYTIFSLSTSLFTSGRFLDCELSPKDFIIESENYGIPQARHRVILLGIRNDFVKYYDNQILKCSAPPTVEDAICDLPKLRSGLSKGIDNCELWSKAIQHNLDRVIRDAESHGLYAVAKRMRSSAKKLGALPLERGSNWSLGVTSKPSRHLGRALRKWFKDPAGWKGVCNHDSRGHIPSDLQRYLFCACYSHTAKRNERQSPKVDDFPESLAPNHANWKSGHFVDRFRVQTARGVASTITSHISKDGHYFIHYDPIQCRSLTVREAARIQTFPDNYFFVGNRTEQYVQVGNAVPPYLANQIAEIVYAIVSAG